MIETFDFSSEKNALLIETRGISFEEVINVLSQGRQLDIIDHPNRDQYPHQRMYVVELNNYVYLVPFVKKGKKVFLKTIFPNREATKKYLSKEEK